MTTSTDKQTGDLPTSISAAVAVSPFFSFRVRRATSHGRLCGGSVVVRISCRTTATAKRGEGPCKEIPTWGLSSTRKTVQSHRHVSQTTLRSHFMAMTCRITLKGQPKYKYQPADEGREEGEGVEGEEGGEEEEVEEEEDVEDDDGDEGDQDDEDDGETVARVRDSCIDRFCVCVCV